MSKRTWRRLILYCSLLTCAVVPLCLAWHVTSAPSWAQKWLRRQDDASTVGFRIMDWLVGQAEPATNVKSVTRQPDPIREGLAWLRSMQFTDGHWDGHGHAPEDGSAGDWQADCQMTALALYAHVGAGYTLVHHHDELGRGLTWLRDQDLAKLCDENFIAYCWCALLFAEVVAHGGDHDLRAYAQTLADRIVDRLVYCRLANRSVGGWCGSDPLVIDTVHTAVALGSLQAARIAGLDVGKAPSACEAWYDHAWLTDNPGPFDVKKHTASFPSGIRVADGSVIAGDSVDVLHALRSAGRLGWDSADPELATLANTVFAERERLQQDPRLLWLMSQGLFTAESAKWDVWEPAYKDKLRHGARRFPPALAGSWDPIPSPYRQERLPASRALTTAYHVLALEIYYLYRQERPGPP